mmetsp:Transcript_20118/g.38079  ORF Transcript_20118/g.38079 Transcript_20118/m.38079 type:complete len:528 (-) Transcript_20118:21-1604(-)
MVTAMWLPCWTCLFLCNGALASSTNAVEARQWQCSSESGDAASCQWWPEVQDSTEEGLEMLQVKIQKVDGVDKWKDPVGKKCDCSGKKEKKKRSDKVIVPDLMKKKQELEVEEKNLASAKEELEILQNRSAQAAARLLFLEKEINLLIKQEFKDLLARRAPNLNLLKAIETKKLDLDVAQKAKEQMDLDIETLDLAVAAHASMVEKLKKEVFDIENEFFANGFLLEVQNQSKAARKKDLAILLSRESELGEIPKIIHHTYKEDLSKENASFPVLVWRVAFESWKEHFPSPEYEYMFWDNAALLECVKTEFPNFLEAFEKIRGSIEASDIGRYCILHQRGGIYADLDYEVLQNFYKILPRGTVSLLESPEVENEATQLQYQNALMASPPKHPLWQRVFDFISATGDKATPQAANLLEWDPEQHTWDKEHGSGPRMISRMAEMYPGDVYPLACNRFQRRHGDAKDCGDPNDFESAVGIHWNSQSYSTWKPFGGLKSPQGSWRDETFRKLHPDLQIDSLHEKSLFFFQEV